MNNKKKIIIEMFLNIIATSLPILILQLVILPLVANEYDDFQYGTMISSISIILLFSQAFSISLTNTRLILNNKYIDKKESGDFNFILTVFIVLQIIATIVVFNILDYSLNYLDIILIVIIGIIQLSRKYYIVTFRLKIEYKSILIANIILILGYLVGFYMFYLTNIWQFIYLIGEIGSLLYILFKTDLYKEPFNKTKLFKNTLNHCIILIFASLFGSALTYFDKIILYPLLGAEIIAIYYVATIIGKMTSMLVGPINNVILSYLSKTESIKFKSKIKLVISVVCIAIVGYIITLLASGPVLNIIYPQYASEALKLIYITAGTAMIIMVNNLLNPFVIKFYNIKWQIVTHFINFSVYIVLALILSKSYSIYGFCYAGLLAAGIKLTIIIMILFNKMNKFKNIKEKLV